MVKQHPFRRAKFSDCLVGQLQRVVGGRICRGEHGAVLPTFQFNAAGPVDLKPKTAGKHADEVRARQWFADRINSKTYRLADHMCRPVCLRYEHEFGWTVVSASQRET